MKNQNKKFIILAILTVFSTPVFAAINTTGDITETPWSSPIQVYDTWNIGHETNASVTISETHNLEKQWLTILGRNQSASGTINVQGQNAKYTTSQIANGVSGNGTITITNGGQIQVNHRTSNSRYNNAIGVLNIIGKSNSGNPSRLITKFFDNGFTSLNTPIAGLLDSFYFPDEPNGDHGSGTINIAESGQLLVNTTFKQNGLSKLVFEISDDYLSTQNHWAITGNTQEGELTNQGVTSVELDGLLNIQQKESYNLAPSQIYNLLQIATGVDSLAGGFAAQSQNSIVSFHNGLNLYINYQGGDGNDITLFTLPQEIQGDTNGDAIVDQQDLSRLIKYFGIKTPKGDANHDGKTDLKDLFQIRNNFSQGAPPITIPEPASLIMLITLSSVILKR